MVDVRQCALGRFTWTAWSLRVIALITLLAIPAVGGAAEEVRARAALEAALAEAEYQTRLPDGTVFDRSRVFDGRGKAPTSPWDGWRLELGPWSGQVLDAILWLIVLMALGSIIVLLVHDHLSDMWAWRHRTRGSDQAVVVGEPEDPPLAPYDIDDAEMAARAGDYSEAIHLLLAICLQNLVTDGGVPIPRAFTSREIVERMELGTAKRVALGRLVAWAERCHFGGQSADDGTFRDCIALLRAVVPESAGGR